MPGASLNLLVVDDEPMTRTLLSKILTQRGHTVRCAEDGFSALEKMREVLPDILLSDLNMPGMSGFELLSVVRRRLPGIYVIATSGAYSGKSVPAGIAADAFHEKATSMEALVELIEVASRAAKPRRRGLSRSVTIWIFHTDSEAGVTGFMISCPDCLRIFAEASRGPGSLIHRTECSYCHTAVDYAMVQPLDPGTSQPFVRKLVAGAA
jgi:CheY-like chemotaxis protein